MSSPYYSPSRRQHHQLPPGDGCGPDGYFSPDRSNASSSRMQPQHPGQGTGGLGNASQYYRPQQDAPPGCNPPAFGTGTDGFGGQDVYEDPNGRGRHASPYAQDYRNNYEQRNDNMQTPGQYNQPTYLTPVYGNTPQGSSMTLPDENRRFQPPIAAPYEQQYLHEYPPRHSFNTSPGPYDQRGYNMNRSDSQGFYLDRAPEMDKLNDAQKKIAKEFPKDLDDNEGSMMKSAVSSVKDWRTWIKWKYIRESFALKDVLIFANTCPAAYYIITIVIILLVAFLTVYHKQIVEWLTPTSKKVRSVSWGWIIPVIILFIISFPPLFGHEIVGILLGVVYGLWIGFGILALGTLLGEWGNFYAFKHFLKKHAERYERTSLNYACMAYIVREGGFLVILLARLSAIPGHFTTAVFATVGMNFFMFTIATLLSMPKLIVVVYLGVAIESSGSGTESTKSKLIKYAVIILSTLVTILVALYLYTRMRKARPIVQARMQQKRYDMLLAAASGGIPTNQSNDSVFAADESTAKLNEVGAYSVEDVHRSLPEQDLSPNKGGSRWKWGKKRNQRDGHIEEGKGDTFIMENGMSVNLEDKRTSRFSPGKEERLRGNNMQYVKKSDGARPDQRQDERQWREQQEEAGYPPFTSHSAPPMQDSPYQELDRRSPYTAPPHLGPPGYHQDPLSQQDYRDPRLR
jgi:uncharacterized membrane protein YdjX (TVP38/TMEM64 family)